MSELRRGDLGERVRQVQAQLLAKGHALGGAGADAIFGPATEAAVRAFQRASGLPETGVVDDATWAKLGLKEAPSAPGAPRPKGRAEGLAKDPWIPALAVGVIVLVIVVAAMAMDG